MISEGSEFVLFIECIPEMQNMAGILKEKQKDFIMLIALPFFQVTLKGGQASHINFLHSVFP